MDMRRRFAIARLALVAGAISVAWSISACAHRPVHRNLRALVMDFENVIPGEQGAAFPQSLAEMMTAGLANQPGVTIIDRQDIARLQAEAATRPNRWQYLGRKARADYLVIGSIGKLDRNYVINVRLVTVETGQIVTGSSIARSCNRQEDIYPVLQYMADMMGMALQQLDRARDPRPAADAGDPSQASQSPSPGSASAPDASQSVPLSGQ